jgi:Haloacid dehalogenase-like hydrolase
MPGLLLDLDGVFYVGDDMVPGAADAVDWLRRAGVPHLFLTNTTSRPIGDRRQAGWDWDGLDSGGVRGVDPDSGRGAMATSVGAGSPSALRARGNDDRPGRSRPSAR